MQSISAVLKSAIMDVMSDGREREVYEIKTAIQEKHNMIYKKDYREGHWAGALRSLKTAGKLEMAGRGVYKTGRGIPEPAIVKTEIRGAGTTALSTLKVQEVERMIEEKCRDENTEATLEQLKEEMFSALELQYQYLLQKLETRTIKVSSPLASAELKCAAKLLELKNDLEEILRKNQD